MNSREEWRRIILSINDNTFFDLMRNYLGPVETPFNKQDLIDRLVNFLSREDIHRTVLSLIDDDDASILTALSLSGGLTEKELRNFFPRWTYLELLNRTGNLEERFLIYRRKGLYCLSPLFEKELKKNVVSPDRLIRTVPAPPGFDPLLWLNDPLMLALYSFLGKEGNLIKSDGSLNKRCITRAEQTFPVLFSGPEGLRRFELCLKVLENLGLTSTSEGTLSPDRAQWFRLAEKKTGERYALYYGAALADSPGDTVQTAGLFARLCSRFPRDRTISDNSLAPFISIFCSPVQGFDGDKFREILTELNVFVASGGACRLNGAVNLHGEDPPPGESLVIQPNFEVTVKPSASLSAALRAVEALELELYDLFSRYSLTRKSFLKAVNRGLKIDSFFEDLKALTGKDIPQNISVSLKDWADDHGKSTIFRGVVLKVAPDRARILEKTSLLEPYVVEVLAEGIYLLDQSSEKQWTAALENLSILPGEFRKSDADQGREYPGIVIPRYKDHLSWEIGNKAEGDFAGELTRTLREKLDRKSIKGEEKTELEARIARKLIIHESQLNRGIIRPEITEAKGMNFQGKIRLVEAALQNSSDRLEVSYFTGGENVTILLKPLELAKNEHERILRGTILPDEEPFSIKLGKISKLRKIRSSLF